MKYKSCKHENHTKKIINDIRACYVM